MKLAFYQKNGSFGVLMMLGLMLIICVVACQYALSRILYRGAENIMVDQMFQSRTLIDERLQRYYETLLYVNSVADSRKTAREDLNEYVRAVNPVLKDFSLIGAITPKGNMLYGDELPYDIVPLLQQTMRGHDSIQFFRSDFYEHVIISVPCWRDGMVCGAVYGILNSEAMNNLFYKEEANGLLFAASYQNWRLGTNNMSVEAQEVVQEFFQSEKHWNSLAQKLYYGDYGIEAFSAGSEDWYMISAVVPEMEGWYLYRLVPAWAVNTTIYRVLYLVLAASMILAALFWVSIWSLESNQRKNNEKLMRLAYVDGLTELNNYDGIKRAWQDEGDAPASMFVLDFNAFGSLNMIMGNDYGDAVLKKTAVILLESINHDEMACRVTADRFAILLHSEDAVERVKDLLQRIRDSITEYTAIISAGGSRIEENDSLDEAYERAVTALKYAKRGSDRVVVYDQKMYEEQQMQKRLEYDFSRALEKHELELYLQAKHHLHSAAWAGSEALIRWNHPDLGLIMPYRFVPLLESSGEVKKLDLYVLREACSYIRRWMDAGREIYPISINISRAHFSSKDLLKDICSVVDSFDVPRHLLELEITESAFFGDTETMIEQLISISRAGFRLAIDDFGTGYSSLSMLEQIPANVLKLDRNFVLGWEKNRNSKLIVNVVKLAKAFGMSTVIEGVETEEQAAMARENGCDVVQGWLYAKAEPIDAYEKRVYGGSGDE